MSIQIPVLINGKEIGEIYIQNVDSNEKHRPNIYSAQITIHETKESWKSEKLQVSHIPDNGIWELIEKVLRNINTMRRLSNG